MLTALSNTPLSCSRRELGYGREAMAAQVALPSITDGVVIYLGALGREQGLAATRARLEAEKINRR